MPRFSRKLAACVSHIKMPLVTPPATAGHRTKQEFVYHTLHKALLACEIEPGERLVIDDLAKRLGVSIIPVREALQLLQAEGLVVNVPHVGATAAPLSRESIVDVFSVLEGLEVVGTRLVAERGSTEAVKALAPIVAAMDAAAGTRRFEQWADLNTRFHQAISAATGLPLLLEMTERMLGRWDRIRRHYFKGVLRHRVLEAQREHRNILSALEDRDLPRLQSEVQHHNRCALAAYLRYVDTHTGTPAATSASARS
jgi:DNA-binding GntR family transcriptional regulator